MENRTAIGLNKTQSCIIRAHLGRIHNNYYRVSMQLAEALYGNTHQKHYLWQTFSEDHATQIHPTNATQPYLLTRLFMWVYIIYNLADVMRVNTSLTMAIQTLRQ